MKSLAGELFLIMGNTMDTITQQLSHLAIIQGKAAVAVGAGGLLRDKNGTIATWTWGPNFKPEVSSAGKYFLSDYIMLLLIRQVHSVRHHISIFFSHLQ